MINLLPPATKESYKFARKNSVLRKWLIWLSCGIVGIIAVTMWGTVFLNQAVKDNQVLVNNTNQQLKDQNLDGTTKQVTAISNNLKLMDTVLSQEVLFSALLNQVAKAMPTGAVLTGINITGISGGINLQAATNNYNTATQIQINLEDPNNKIFSKADIVSIQCSAGGTGLASNYPCKSQFRAQFVKNNPFLFVNANTSGSN